MQRKEEFGIGINTEPYFKEKLNFGGKKQ